MNTMIVTLRVKCLSAENCIHLIEIDASSSFLDLHYAIQEAMNFDNDHLFEFFFNRAPRRRNSIPVGDVPDWDTFDPFKHYKNVRLVEEFPISAGFKLFYLFDFGDNWMFQISDSRRKPKAPEPGISYPRVVDSKGSNPQQYGEWD